MTFHSVMPLDELWLGDMVGRVIDGTKVLILRIEDDVFAYEDRCAHLGVSLSEGTLEGSVLTCSAHRYKYDARSGEGINPKAAQLRAFEVKIDAGQVWVDVPDRSTEGLTKTSLLERRHSVGPVLESSDLSSAIVAALRESNEGIVVEDRGSYVRVLVPDRCLLRRDLVEQMLGRPFRLPGDLELCMVSFKGKLTLTAEEAVWAFGER
jgi:nitrite reductase/ring-hydroxylating ferredoxin subunit